MRVFVVDDSPTARRMLRLVLAERDGVDVVGEAVSAEDCLARVADFAPDVVVMDWRMPGMNGAEATRSCSPAIRGYASSGLRPRARMRPVRPSSPPERQRSSPRNTQATSATTYAASAAPPSVPLMRPGRAGAHRNAASSWVDVLARVRALGDLAGPP